jgi:hypothetical protein
MGWFVYRAFKALRDEKAAGMKLEAESTSRAEEETVSS